MNVGFDIMSGLQKKGIRGCPSCDPDLDGIARSCKSHNKVISLDHTKYSPLDHPMRMQRELVAWDGPMPEPRPIPIRKDALYWKQVLKAENDPDNPLQHFYVG